MGDNGQGSSNGGGGGTQRAPAASTAMVNLSQMQALAQKTGAAADAQLAQMIAEATSRKVKVYPDQQNTDTQRFVNATGLADKKPVVVNSQRALLNAQFTGDTVGEVIYHTDAPAPGVSDAKTFGDQYQKGRAYLSSGVYGDGTYFSNSSDGSWSYGYGNGYQIMGMLNSNARVINRSALRTKIKAFKRSHPQAAKVIRGMSTGYGGTDGLETIYAVLFGYNVVRIPSCTYRPGEHYYSVVDRSATTVVKKGVHWGENW